MSSLNLTPVAPASVATPTAGTKSVFLDSSNGNNPALMDDTRTVGGFATKAGIGLGNVDNTSDATKPVSTAQAVADAAVLASAVQRANHTGNQSVATITGLAAVATSGLKADVGLGSVDNTSDATKNAASATLTNKTLTSPVVNSPTGIVKSDIGLANVDNISDANKPVSTATQTALNLKASKAKIDGAFLDVVVDYGADPTGVADSTTAIQNAINAAQSANGGVVFFPKGYFKITSTLNVTSNSITLKGAGAAYTTDVGNYKLGGASWIVWGASSSNIAVKVSPVPGAGNQAIQGFCFEDLSIDCRNNDVNQATIGLQLLSCHGFKVHKFFIIDPIVAALDMNVVATLGEARDCTRGEVSRGALRCLDGGSAGAIGIRLDGDATANTCCNEFRTIQIMHAGTSGNAAIELLNSDSNLFFNCYVNRASGTNVGIRLNGSSTAATLVARNNVFFSCSAGLGGALGRATALTFPALDNYFYGYQVGNGEPVPVIEAGSSLYFQANGTQNGGAFSTFLGNIPSMKLNANYTNSTVTAANTTLQFYAQPGEVFKIEFNGTTQCSGIGGSKYQITAPAGATVEGWLYSSAAAITTLSYQRIVAINTLNATATHTVATTPGPDRIVATVTIGATGGVVAIAAASVTAAQITTIFAGSSLTARKVNGV